ncbi:DegT/DnrJ/EryC1/StrS aminotransferase family protein [Rhodoferax sp. BLA1]|uniref:DegT/DnrJ/EryC1/StrS family aminotransferase n=1 Tax=Rhodoferax sp. BLA1 TaxID=2576062 RepID=UPI0015D3CFEC|nr:DegT/DnrJ/EryC1/StrS family aminotransferase [Rhodoferax sp. BLA1]
MNSNRRIPLSRPSITDEEVALATDAARNGWGPHCYDYLDRFEAAFAAHIGVKYAIATSSCTGALHMGLAALGVGEGDEIILADTNWVASVAPVLHLGARPVLVDIQPDSWCIDPVAVRAAITPRTRAIIAVHLYGNLCDMDALLALGREFDIPVIEDAAEAIGSMYGGSRAGALGVFGAFSFHGSKTITTGEGGMFVTDEQALYDKVLSLSNHGRVKGQTRQFWPDMLGFKYKMSNLQAAFGCAQLRRVESLISRKLEIMQRYREAFADVSGITMNPELPGTRIGAWMPTVVVAEHIPLSADELLHRFKQANIDARPFFAPLSTLTWMPPGPTGSHAQSVYERAVNLPSFHDMTDHDIDRVVAVVREALQHAGA